MFVFDLLACDANLDHLKNGGPERPYPLGQEHVDMPLTPESVWRVLSENSLRAAAG